MLKFFKNIRKNLLTEGKTSKYLKYAFGEIILVVIGILIALQINNWNTARKNKDLKKTYYLQMLQDLEKDKIRLTESSHKIDSFFVRLYAYKEIYKEPDISIWGATTEIGKVFLTEAGKSWNFESNTNTINTLRNTGDIKLIPIGIRNKILDYRYKSSGLMDYLKSQSISIANASIVTQKLYGGPDFPIRIGNQPKLLAYFNDEKIAIQTLLELEAILYENTLLLKNVKERIHIMIKEIDEIMEILNEELEK